MSLITAKIVPPISRPDNFVVTVWVRGRRGLIERKRVETDAGNEVDAKWCAIRHLGLHRGDGMNTIENMDIRRRSEVA